MLPLARRTSAALSNWLGWRWNGAARLEPDLDRVPAMADERDAQWARIASADFLEPDEKRALLGLPPRGGVATGCAKE